MRVLHLDQLEVLLPIGPLFLQGSRTIANLNPAGGAVLAKPGFLHVAQVLAAGYRTFAQCSAFNRLKKGPFAAWLDAGAHQIPHAVPILAAPPFRGPQHSDSRRDRDPAVDRPADLTGHEAARQYVNALQEPDHAKDNQDHAHDVQGELQSLPVSSHFHYRIPGELRQAVKRGFEQTLDIPVRTKVNVVARGAGRPDSVG